MLLQWLGFDLYKSLCVCGSLKQEMACGQGAEQAQPPSLHVAAYMPSCPCRGRAAQRDPPGASSVEQMGLAACPGASELASVSASRGPLGLGGSVGCGCSMAVLLRWARPRAPLSLPASVSRLASGHRNEFPTVCGPGTVTTGSFLKLCVSKHASMNHFASLREDYTFF